MQSEMQGLNMYAMKTVYVFSAELLLSGALACHSIDYVPNPFTTYYSVPVRSVYYPSADMIIWAVRISGLIRNRWFLVSGKIIVGMEVASKERLNNE